jgi:4-amino-4-deoxy-L-arabinose transferase-like glycosyltransferase
VTGNAPPSGPSAGDPDGEADPTGAAPSSAQRRRVAPDELSSWIILLALIVVAFIIQGVVAEPGPWEVTINTALLGATLMLALHVAQARRWARNIIGAFVVAMFLATLIQAIGGTADNGADRLTDALLVALAPPAVFVGVVRRLRATQAVSVDAVIGVLCVYILIGMFFAFVYGSIDRFTTAPFFAQGVAATLPNCMYFSYTTLATIGYGDLTAASNVGHTLAVSEGLLGQVYLVTVVSLIVGNLGRRRVQ